MKVRSWSKPYTSQSTLHMLSADHLNIDGPPFPVKCVRKFKSALGEEVAYRCVCVGARAHACFTNSTHQHIYLRLAYGPKCMFFV